MRVLFASTRGTGHFTPLVPLIEAAVRGGHEVMVGGPPPLAEAVERAGYPFWEGAEPPEDELGPLWARVPSVSREEANAIVVGGIFAGLNVHAMLPSLEAACEDWRPDLLIREEAEIASAIAAERHGFPTLASGSRCAPWKSWRSSWPEPASTTSSLGSPSGSGSRPISRPSPLGSRTRSAPSGR